MSEKLVIALYNNSLITLLDYHDSIHKGKIFCPFCDPPLRVSYNVLGFFRAWPGEGGHNCGRGQVIYFDADWKGRDITEIINIGVEGLEVVIDINSLVNRNYQPNDRKTIRTENTTPMNSKQYAIYKDKKEVFRDVIRSVLQMKRLLENNDYNQIKKVKFNYKTSYDQIQTIDDIVIESYKLTSKYVDRSIFIIFAVTSVYLKNGIIYVNAKSYEGVNLTATFPVKGEENPYIELKGNYVIAFGKVTYSKQYNKYFLNLNNDFQIVKLNNKKSEKIFENKQILKYDYSNYVSKKKNDDETPESNLYKKNIQKSKPNDSNTNFSEQNTSYDTGSFNEYISSNNNETSETVYNSRIMEEEKQKNKSNKLKNKFKILLKNFNPFKK